MVRHKISRMDLPRETTRTRRSTMGVDTNNSRHFSHRLHLQPSGVNCRQHDALGNESPAVSFIEHTSFCHLLEQRLVTSSALVARLFWRSSSLRYGPAWRLLYPIHFRHSSMECQSYSYFCYRRVDSLARHVHQQYWQWTFRLLGS